MENFKIIDNKITSGSEDKNPKKIKVTEQNYSELLAAQDAMALEEMKNKIDAEIAQQEARVAELKEEIATVEEQPVNNMFGTVEETAEEPVVEENTIVMPSFFEAEQQEETPIEEKEENVIEEPVIESEENDEIASEIEADIEQEVKPFGYYYEKPVEDITQAQIDSINEDLGNSYKGNNMNQNLSRLIDNIPEEKEDVEIITIDNLNSELNKDSYLEKTKQYKDIVKEGLDEITDEISSNTENRNQYKHSIKAAEDEKKELTQSLVGYLEEINSTNELQLKYMEESANTNQKAKEAIQAVGLYYNDLREKAQALQDEIREKTHNIDVLKMSEQEAIKIGAELKEKLDNFIKEKYESLVKVNERDENSRRDAEEISEITGIKEEKEDKVEKDLDELPKKVINVQSYDSEVVEKQRGMAA